MASEKSRVDCFTRFVHRNIGSYFRMAGANVKEKFVRRTMTKICRSGTEIEHYLRVFPAVMAPDAMAALPLVFGASVLDCDRANSGRKPKIRFMR
jgi:hypothetical protein